MLVPCAPDALHGNATTANRLRDGLRRRGWDTTVQECPAEGLPADAPGRADADVVIALHAAKCGPCGAAISAELNVPLVIVFAGTDLNGRPAAATREAVASAASLVALGASARRRARDLFDALDGRLEVIPQAVLPLPRGGTLPDGVEKKAEGELRVLLPSGIRPIKDPLRAVRALAPLAARKPGLRLILAGAELDPACGEELRTLLEEHPWARWIGAVERDQLGALLRSADVVLSTSRSEGGPPNMLLEAVQLSIPVLASAIPAHRDFPGDPHLFHDDTGLRVRLQTMLDAPELTRMELRRLEEAVRHTHSASREAEAWDRMLRRVRAGNT